MVQLMEVGLIGFHGKSALRRVVEEPNKDTNTARIHERRVMELIALEAELIRHIVLLLRGSRKEAFCATLNTVQVGYPANNFERNSLEFYW